MCEYVMDGYVPLLISRTLLEQCAVIRVIGIPFLQGTLEDMTVRNFESTSTNGRQAIIDIIEKSNKEKL